MDLKNVDENIIWQKLRAGDPDAIASLMHLYLRPLTYYGMRFSSDRELVKDSVQELFLILWDRHRNLNVVVNLKSYLFASLRRLLLRKLKSLNKSSTISIDDYQGESFSFELGIDQKLIAVEQAKQISKHFSKLINLLPTRQREVIYLKFFVSLSRDEIASVLEISPQTVSNIIQMAMRKLKEGTPSSIWLSATVAFFVLANFILDKF
ncbi:MAG: sigma-70 family RNA polymerase sigma factor [Bacteroidetes bacterium]|nr:sigma-70 family RNA polymerase sigma factor [Bacteroidota bacterium]